VSLTRQEMDRSKRQVRFCHSISLAFKLQEPRNQFCAGGNTWKRVHARCWCHLLPWKFDYRIREWIIADIVEKTREILPVGVTLSRSKKRWAGEPLGCKLTGHILYLFV